MKLRMLKEWTDAKGFTYEVGSVYEPHVHLADYFQRKGYATPEPDDHEVTPKKKAKKSKKVEADDSVVTDNGTDA